MEGRLSCPNCRHVVLLHKTGGCFGSNLECTCTLQPGEFEAYELFEYPSETDNDAVMQETESPAL